MGPPRLRLIYHLRDEGSSRKGHCFGVNALQTSCRDRLYSAGRDATIQCWDTCRAAEGKATHVRSFEHHTHWVNDIVLCTPNTLASCSSDTSVKLWRVGEEVKAGADVDPSEAGERGLLMTFEGHTDFVKCLSFASDGKVLASGGMDNRVCIWDLAHSCSPVATLRGLSDDTSCVECTIGGSKDATWDYGRLQKGPALKFMKSSIYSLALSQGGNLALCSGPGRVISGWDVRASRSCFKLKGHQDIVRKLLLLPDCSRVVSASSDCSIRVWDLGQQRCVDNVEVHDDSVWTIAWDKAHSKVYSGGRDRTLWCTDLRTSESTLVAEELHGPVLSLALTNDEQGIWVSSDQPELRLLSLAVSSEDSYSPHEPQVLEELAGRAGIVQHHILNNRRQVLTCDTEGMVKLWDVTGTEPTQRLGQVDWATTVERFHTQQSIPGWFSVDTTLGLLAVRLDESQCFDAIMYPATAGLEPLQAVTVNLGERVIECLFRTWRTKKLLAMEKMHEEAKRKTEEGIGKDLCAGPASPVDDEDEGRKSETAEEQPGDERDGETKAVKNGEEADADADAEDTAPAPEEEVSTKSSPAAADIPAFREGVFPQLHLPLNTPVIIADAETGAVAMRSTIGGFQETDALPAWISNCALRNSYKSRLPSNIKKITFVIKPAKGEVFPKKISTTISGMRWYHARKIHEHVVKAMGLSLPRLPAADGEELGPRVLPEEYLELICNGQVVEASMDLAAVKAFVWKSFGDVTVEFRRNEKYKSDGAA